jgi:putative FmdB family regulatory protein
MPIFEFKCYHCGDVFERLLNPSEIDEVQTCECGYSAKKLVSSPSFKVNGHNESNGYAYKKTAVDTAAPR